LNKTHLLNSIVGKIAEINIDSQNFHPKFVNLNLLAGLLTHPPIVAFPILPAAGQWRE